MSGASERANGGASGPVLQSVFLAVFDHSGREKSHSHPPVIIHLQFLRYPAIYWTEWGLSGVRVGLINLVHFIVLPVKSFNSLLVRHFGLADSVALSLVS